MDSTDLLVGAVISSVALCTLVAIVGGFLHSRRERLLTNQERMKALELGRDLPDDAATARLRAVFDTTSCDDDSNQEESKSLARKCFSTALWVAIAGFIAASSASATSYGVAIAIACSVGAIGVTAMVCGTIIAVQTPAKLSRSRTSKFPIESDAFDVVSRRG